jgi:hypothetical protein
MNTWCEHPDRPMVTIYPLSILLCKFVTIYPTPCLLSSSISSLLCKLTVVWCNMVQGWQVRRHKLRTSLHHHTQRFLACSGSLFRRFNKNRTTLYAYCHACMPFFNFSNGFKVFFVVPVNGKVPKILVCA